VPLLVLCIQEPELSLKRIAASALSDICKHSPELAQAVVNAGGVGAMVDYVTEARGNARLPGIMTLGYISAFSETLALAVVVSKGIPPLINAVVTEPEDHIKSASAWSLGQIGRHSPDHAKALADANALPKLLAVYLHEASSDDLKTKAKRALKSVIQKCVHLPALEPLLHDAPENILKYVVQQFAKVLPHDVAARRSFVTSGGLQKILELQPEQGSKLGDFVRAITECYPKEIVDYYSPNYSKQLLDNLDASELQQ